MNETGFWIIFAIFFMLPYPIYKGFRWIALALCLIGCGGAQAASIHWTQDGYSYGGPYGNCADYYFDVSWFDSDGTSGSFHVEVEGSDCHPATSGTFTRPNAAWVHVTGVGCAFAGSVSKSGIPSTWDSCNLALGYQGGSTVYAHATEAVDNATNYWSNYSLTNTTLLNQWLLFRRTNDTGGVSITDIGLLAPGASVDLRLTNGAWFGWSLIDGEGHQYANGVASTSTGSAYLATNSAPYNPVSVPDPIKQNVTPIPSGSLTNQSSDENTRQGFNALIQQQAQIQDKMGSNNVEGNGLLREIKTNTAALQGELTASATNKIEGFRGGVAGFASNQQFMSTNFLSQQSTSILHALRVTTNWATAPTEDIWLLRMPTNHKAEIGYVDMNPRHHKLWELSPFVSFGMKFLAVAFACMTLWEALQDHLFRFYSLGGRMTGVTWAGILWTVGAAGVAGAIIGYIVTSVAGAWMDTALMGGNTGIFSDAAAAMGGSWVTAIREGISVIGDFLPLKEMLIIYSGYWTSKTTMDVCFLGWGIVGKYIM